MFRAHGSLWARWRRWSCTIVILAGVALAGSFPVRASSHWDFDADVTGTGAPHVRLQVDSEGFQADIVHAKPRIGHLFLRSREMTGGWFVVDTPQGSMGFGTGTMERRYAGVDRWFLVRGLDMTFHRHGQVLGVVGAEALAPGYTVNLRGLSGSFRSEGKELQIEVAEGSYTFPDLRGDRAGVALWSRYEAQIPDSDRKHRLEYYRFSRNWKNPMAPARSDTDGASWTTSGEDDSLKVEWYATGQARRLGGLDEPAVPGDRNTILSARTIVSHQPRIKVSGRTRQTFNRETGRFRSAHHRGAVTYEFAGILARVPLTGSWIGDYRVERSSTSLHRETGLSLEVGAELPLDVSLDLKGGYTLVDAGRRQASELGVRLEWKRSKAETIVDWEMRAKRAASGLEVRHDLELSFAREIGPGTEAMWKVNWDPGTASSGGGEWTWTLTLTAHGG